jgi:uncharacterized protein YndB with AHSA1/START domain
MTETTSERLELRRELSIAARPETVWGFLVEPDKQMRWMGGAVELDPRPGGVVRIEVVSGNVVRGEVVVADPPRRLVYTWGWEQGSPDAAAVPPGSTTVVFELEADGEGTLLRFAHLDLPTAESVERHTHGWDHYLPRLEVAAGGGDPGRDPWSEENSLDAAS